MATIYTQQWGRSNVWILFDVRIMNAVKMMLITLQDLALAILRVICEKSWPQELKIFIATAIMDTDIDPHLSGGGHLIRFDLIA